MVILRSQRPSVDRWAYGVRMWVGLGWGRGEFGGGARGQEGKQKRTVVTAPDAPAVDHGLPDEQLVVVDGPQALDALLAGRLGLGPRVELPEQTADDVAREGG
jgi:hypothetical protein